MVKKHSDKIQRLILDHRKEVNTNNYQYEKTYDRKFNHRTDRQETCVMLTSNFYAYALTRNATYEEIETFLDTCINYCKELYYKEYGVEIECTYKINYILNRGVHDGSTYIYFSNPIVFNLIQGLNFDGSERVKVVNISKPENVSDSLSSNTYRLLNDELDSNETEENDWTADVLEATETIKLDSLIPHELFVLPDSDTCSHRNRVMKLAPLRIMWKNTNTLVIFNVPAGSYDEIYEKFLSFNTSYEDIKLAFTRAQTGSLNCYVSYYKSEDCCFALNMCKFFTLTHEGKEYSCKVGFFNENNHKKALK